MSEKLNEITVLECFRYCPNTGIFHWRFRPKSHFSEDIDWKRWNSQNSGNQAFTSNGNRGYKKGCVFGKSYSAHRVAFLYMHGDWPINQVDHLDGDTANNKWENLEDVTAEGNGRNRKKNGNNTSGTTGVNWSRSNNKWEARINHKGVRKSLGLFDSLESAKLIRELAEVEYGYSQRGNV